MSDQEKMTILDKKFDEIKEFREAIIKECGTIQNNLKSVVSKLESTSPETLKNSFQSISKFLQNLVGMIKGIDQKFKELEASIEQASEKLANFNK